MKIQESAENYLETILMLSQRGTDVRSIDIANDMNYSKPSISVAMKNLRLNGYINVDESGFITLTDSGMEIASNIYDRHLMCALAGAMNRVENGTSAVMADVEAGWDLL